MKNGGRGNLKKASHQSRHSKSKTMCHKENDKHQKAFIVVAKTLSKPNHIKAHVFLTIRSSKDLAGDMNSYLLA